MAKKAKKAAKKKAVNKYLILTSDCGSLDQLCVPGYATSYPSVEAAKKASAEFIDDSESGDRVQRMVIVEIIDIGEPSGIEWSGKTDFND